MTFVLAFFRVLNKPKCSKESAEHLQQLKQEMEEKSKHWENQPEQKLEKEREIATHILSISDSIKDGAISFLSTEYFYMAFFVGFMFIIVGNTSYSFFLTVTCVVNFLLLLRWSHWRMGKHCSILHHRGRSFCWLWLDRYENCR